MSNSIGPSFGASKAPVNQWWKTGDTPKLVYSSNQAPDETKQVLQRASEKLQGVKVDQFLESQPPVRGRSTQKEKR